MATDINLRAVSFRTSEYSHSAGRQTDRAREAGLWRVNTGTSPGCAPSVHFDLHPITPLGFGSPIRKATGELELKSSLSGGVRKGEALSPGDLFTDFSATLWNEPCLRYEMALTAYFGSSLSIIKSFRFKTSFQILIIQMVGDFYPARAQFFPPHTVEFWSHVIKSLDSQDCRRKPGAWRGRKACNGCPARSPESCCYSLNHH